MTQEDKQCCERCERTLTQEELNHPHDEREGWARLCECCYDEFFRDMCDRCGEYTDKNELASNPGELLAVWRETPAGMSHRKDLEPGYYRVKGWPLYTDAMFFGYMHAEKLERVAALDAKGLRAAKGAYTCAAPVCEACRSEIQKAIDSGLPA